MRAGCGDMQLARCSAKPRLGHRWLRHRGELLLGDRHNPSWHGLIALRRCVLAQCNTEHAERLHAAGVVVVSAVPFKAETLQMHAWLFKRVPLRTGLASSCLRRDLQKWSRCRFCEAWCDAESNEANESNASWPECVDGSTVLQPKSLCSRKSRLGTT